MAGEGSEASSRKGRGPDREWWMGLESQVGQSGLSLSVRGSHTKAGTAK